MRQSREAEPVFRIPDQSFVGARHASPVLTLGEPGHLPHRTDIPCILLFTSSHTTSLQIVPSGEYVMKRLLPILLLVIMLMGVVLPSVKVSYAQDGDGTTQNEPDTTNADNLDETNAPEDDFFCSTKIPTKVSQATSEPPVWSRRWTTSTCPLSRHRRMPPRRIRHPQQPRPRFSPTWSALAAQPMNRALIHRSNQLSRRWWRLTPMAGALFYRSQPLSRQLGRICSLAYHEEPITNRCCASPPI